MTIADTPDSRILGGQRGPGEASQYGIGVAPTPPPSTPGLSIAHPAPTLTATPTYSRIAGSSETGFDEAKPKRGRPKAEAGAKSKPARSEVLAALRAFDPEAPAQKSAAEKERERLVAQATTATRSLVKTLEGLGIADSSDTASAAAALGGLGNALKKMVSALEAIPDSKLNLDATEDAAPKPRKPRGRPRKEQKESVLADNPAFEATEGSVTRGEPVKKSASDATSKQEQAAPANAQTVTEPAVRAPSGPVRTSASASTAASTAASTTRGVQLDEDEGF